MSPTTNAKKKPTMENFLDKYALGYQAIPVEVGFACGGRRGTDGRIKGDFML